MRTSIRPVRLAPPARLAAVLAGAAIGIGAVLLPSDAHALADVACAGSASTTFSPGLTNTPQRVLVTANDAYTCLSLTNPAIRSATSTVAGSVTDRRSPPTASPTTPPASSRSSCTAPSPAASSAGRR